MPRDDDYLRAITTWLNRTSEVAVGLGDQWVNLGALVTPSRSGGDDSGIRSKSVHAAAPIRIEIVSMRDDIAATAAKYCDLVRGTLRMGVKRNPVGVPNRLRFIGHTLPRLHAADPDLTEELANAIWDHHRAASRVLDGPGRPRPRRIPDACPECGYESLWVDPARWVIACGMPECGGVWGVGQPVLKHSSQNAKYEV